MSWAERKYPYFIPPRYGVLLFGIVQLIIGVSMIIAGILFLILVTQSDSPHSEYLFWVDYDTYEASRFTVPGYFVSLGIYNVCAASPAITGVIKKNPHQICVYFWATMLTLFVANSWFAISTYITLGRGQTIVPSLLFSAVISVQILNIILITYREMELNKNDHRTIDHRKAMTCSMNMNMNEILLLEREIRMTHLWNPDDLPEKKGIPQNDDTCEAEYPSRPPSYTRHPETMNF